MNAADSQYHDLVERILASGDRRKDRTGIGTRAVFGAMVRFDLAKGFPLLTTKRVFWKLAIKEMLWFLTGATNIRPLLQQGVRIWSDWPLDRYRAETGDAIDQLDFEARILADADFAARWGELGPVYGRQWRRWQGPDGRVHDQIATLITTLRTNPASRRMLFHGWNVGELEGMALPPCHLLYQYHVTSDGRLNALLYQRSADILLGVPFNWVGAAALQMMLAQQTDLVPGELVWMGGDVHLYDNHDAQAREQLTRAARPAPHMRLNRRAPSIDEYTIDDFALEGYDPHPAIAAPVAV